MALEFTQRIDNKSCKMIDVGFSDPKNFGFFGKQKSDAREAITFYYCSCHENCEAYQNGTCLLKTGLYGIRCPYGFKKREEGYTPRARSYDAWLTTRRDRYEDRTSNLKEVKTLTEIGKEHIYLPLAYLNNYVNPIIIDLNMYSQYLINKKYFTPETVIKLITYRPRALMDNSVIKDYITKYLPDFVFQLSKKYPDIYEQVVEVVPDIKAWVDTPDFTGKKAKVKSLLPGKVKFGIHIVNWDGEKIITDSKELALFGWNDDEVVHIFPTDKTYVEIIDNATIDKDKVEFA